MKKIYAALLSGLIALGCAALCNAAETPVKGDVDLNGKIEAHDSACALQYTLTGPQTGFTEKQIWAADVDGKDGVTAYDAAMILQKVLLSTYEFPNNSAYPTEETTVTDTTSEYTTEATTAEATTEATTAEVTTAEATTEATTAEATTEASTEATTVNTDDGIVVTDFAALKSALNSGEKKIYISGSIDCDEQLKLSKKNANTELYGLTNDDGTGAVLDFASLRDNRSSSGSGGTGIIISGTDYAFTNLFIQNAGDCGIRINSEGAGNCVFTNCVFRYNNNSGISVTNGGENNEFYCCDSYRNGDIVQKSGADADGFSVKLGAGGGNKFYNCRAWENSDDGWDSYNKSGNAPIPDIYYEECLAWHNGNPDIFTGEYDYANGYPLDKNLIYVQAILKADPDFETKYNNREITQWPKVTMKLLGATNTYENLYTYWGGNPNGFKFGSAYSVSSEYRYIKNCIAFDHYGNAGKPVQYRAKGFDQNCGDTDENSQNGPKLIHYDLENILSFNNVENIQMSRMTADSIKGVVWSFDNCMPPSTDTGHPDGYADQPSEGMTITEPANKDELRNTVYAYREMIYGYVYNDKIPGEHICNVFN